MKMLFFGSPSCETCQVMLLMLADDKIISNSDIDFYYIDAYAEDTQDFCDEHDVDDLPRVKIYDNSVLVFDRIGIFNPTELYQFTKEGNDDGSKRKTERSG
ncbi:MAG: thioredoxin family protein [Phenylobacterium sp.]